MTRPRVLVLTRHDVAHAVARGTREVEAEIERKRRWKHRPLLLFVISVDLGLAIVGATMMLWDLLR